MSWAAPTAVSCSGLRPPCLTSFRVAFSQRTGKTWHRSYALLKSLALGIGNPAAPAGKPGGNTGPLPQFAAVHPTQRPCATVAEDLCRRLMAEYVGFLLGTPWALVPPPCCHGSCPGSAKPGTKTPASRWTCNGLTAGSGQG